MTNAGKYEYTITCGAYVNTITYYVDQVSLPLEVVTVAEDKTETSYVENTEVTDNNFIFRSNYEFGIGEDIASLNEETHKYELAKTISETTEIDIVSLNDNYSNIKFNVVIKKVNQTAKVDLSDKKYNSVKALTLSDDSNVKVTISQAQNSTDENGYCVGTKNKPGSITLKFDKNISKITLDLGVWKKATSQVSINDTKYDLSGEKTIFTVELDTDTVTITSTKFDYRFFLRGIEVVYK